MHESQPPIKFHIRDDKIIVFEFFAMDHHAGELFRKLVRTDAENVPDKLRVIYDFSQSPAPTPEFIRIQADLYNTFPHPPDEKSAYVTGEDNSEDWVRIVRSYFDARDTMEIFTTREEAVTWLLE